MEKKGAASNDQAASNLRTPRQPLHADGMGNNPPGTADTPGGAPFQQNSVLSKDMSNLPVPYHQLTFLQVSD